MGKSKKNKKIAKQTKKLNSQRDDVIQIIDDQQIQEHEQGIFQALKSQNEQNDNDNDQNENENECMINYNINNENKYKTNSEKVNYYKFGNGYIILINLNKIYQIINNNEQSSSKIWVIDGIIDINGSKNNKMFQIKAETSLIIMPQAKKHKQSNTIKKQKKQINMDCNGNNLNKNIRQLIYKFNQCDRLNQKIQRNIINEQFVNFFHNYDAQQHAVLYYQQVNITIIKLTNQMKPWHKLNVSHYINSHESTSTLVMGLKNTGKSMLCQYFINQSKNRGTELCVLDFDIGRNRILPGAISLQKISNNQQAQRNIITIWIGQFSPINSIQAYMKAITQLYAYYKNNYYTCNLVVNTMGYLTGVGQLLLYQLFNLIKPKNVLVLQNQKQQMYVKNIINCIESGKYLQRLYFKLNDVNTRTSTKISRYFNHYAQQKSSPKRYEHLFVKDKVIVNFDQLLMLILSNKLRKLKKKIDIIHTTKQGKIDNFSNFNYKSSNMRIVLLAKYFKHNEQNKNANNYLIQVCGLGYGWQENIYYDHRLLMQKQENIQLGILSQNIDFQKKFYLINQARIIQIQDMINKKIPFITPIIKVLGNKGTRNNPAKKAISKQ